MRKYVLFLLAGSYLILFRALPVFASCEEMENWSILVVEHQLAGGSVDITACGEKTAIDYDYYEMQVPQEDEVRMDFIPAEDYTFAGLWVNGVEVDSIEENT